MGVAKYDYPALEKQFVFGEMSIRELCKQNDIKTWSTVSDYAKRNNWVQKREDYQKRQTEANLQKVVETRAERLAAALDAGITISESAMYAFLDSLKDRFAETADGERILIPGQQIPAKDFVLILEKIMVLNGQFTSREEHVSADLTGALTMEALRDILDTARSAGAELGGEAASSPLPRSSGARQVN